MSKSGHFNSILGFIEPSAVRRGCLLVLASSALAIPACAFASDDSTSTASTDVTTQWRHRDSGPDTPDFSVEARQRFPWFVSIGGYFPTFSGDGTSNSVGTEVAFGYRFPVDSADFRISVRGQAFDITDSFGNNSTIDVSELSFDAFYRAEGFYAGPGISFGSVTGTTDGFTFTGSNQTVFSLTAGYDISSRLFVEARWQTADVDAYKGISANIGYRF